MFAKITALTLLSLVLLGPGAASRAEDAPLATVVLFDSVCLTCHEGECSGRLALREGHSPSGLAGHVAGYAGAQPDKTVSQLRDLMGRLKTQCRLPPPPLAVPADGVWTAAELGRAMLPDRKRLFLPLGELDAGPHRLRLRLDQTRQVRLQVVADTFDILVDEQAEIGPAGRVLRWNVDESGPHFLRLIANEPLRELEVRR